MEWFENAWNGISQYVNIPYLVIFMSLSYMIKKHFLQLLNKITGLQWKTVYIVLIIATIVGIPFLIWDDTTWNKLLFSYTIGTSLHELFFKWIEKKITEA